VSAVDVGLAVGWDTLPAAARDRFAACVAAVTVRGYGRPEPVAGLPAPDGRAERSADVLADLERGARVLTVGVDGVPAGAVRMLPGPDGAWTVRRLAVDGRFGGLRLGARLVQAVEDEAARAAPPRCTAKVSLDAVVERGVPPFYARLGYRTVAHWPAGDKPLSEVTMTRSVGGPRRRLDHPWEGDDVAPRDGLLVGYFRTTGTAGAGPLVVTVGPAGGRAADLVREQGLLAAAELGDPSGQLRCVGADHVPGTHRGPVLVGAAASGFAMPRTITDRALALWRVPSGAALPER
jgi:GNAT superfamily N-acetyltransferase